MSRAEELQKIFEEKGWGAIRRIAEKHDIQKPDGGWDDAIPLIVAAEEAAAKGKESAKKLEPKPEPVAAKAEPKADKAVKRYKADWYKSSGIPFCATCGAPNPTDINGNPLCPVANSNCPRLSKV